MFSSILSAIHRKLVICPIIVVSLLVVISLLDYPQSRSSAQPPPVSLCFPRPRARIDLVLPPIDSVPTHSANVLIGSKFKFEVTFDSIEGVSAGFGPYVDVIFPAGIDGAAAQPYDGISFDSASYLGSPIDSSRIRIIPIPASGSVPHPFSSQQITGSPGDQLAVIQIPFGSYTPQQPRAAIIVNALVSPLADIDAALTIRVQAGFRYGCSPTGNSGAIVSNPTDNDSGRVTPVLFTIDKTYDGPEIGPKLGETATGPNFSHHYQITVDIADGQTITNLKVSDLLPNNLAYAGPLSITQVNGAPGIASTPPIGVAASGSILTVSFAYITGTSSLTDVTVQFEFFIPEKDASGTPILDPTTGEWAISENHSQVEGTWTPLDVRDIPPVVEVLDGPVYKLLCKSIALQKRGINRSKGNADVTATSTDNAPGDLIIYTVAYQISDYFTFNEFYVQDLVSDGQDFQTSLAPTFSATDKYQSVSGNFTTDTLKLSVSCFPRLTTLGFKLSEAMMLNGGTGKLTGGYATNDTPLDVGATGTIVFNTRIAEAYTCPVPSGDQSVDQNDKLSNQAAITGVILDNSTLQSIAPMKDDGTVEFKLLIGVLSKSIYARRSRTGVVTLNPPASALFAPGDEITFELRYNLRHGDIEKFSIKEFAPMPVLNLPPQMTQSAPCINLPFGIPPSGQYCLSSSPGLVPLTVTVSPPAAGNSIAFDYGSFDDPLSPVNGKVIDIRFTLTIQNNPFVDGLFLTNQVVSSETNSFNETTTETTIAQFLVAEPNLRIRKGVVDADNMARMFMPPVTPAFPFMAAITSAILSNPNAINSNLSKVDAGDLVTFVVVVENLGSSPYGAFDVRISDTLPAGFLPPFTYKVTDGNLTPILFSGDLFSPNGIELLDKSATTGSLAPFHMTNGKNIAVISYMLRANTNVAPCQALTNTAKIKNYSSVELAPNYAASGYGGPFSDAATVTIANPTISMALLETSQVFTSGANVTIGEEVTYEFTVTLPEGATTALKVTDVVPAGLQVISVDSISAPNYFVSFATPATVPALPAGCGVPVAINFVSTNFGAIIVPADNNPSNNWFKFRLTARVCDVSGNVGFVGSQTILSNAAIAASGNCQDISNAVPITVVEPKLNITKQFTPNVVLPNGTVQIKLVVTNNGTSPAFDVSLSDELPIAIYSAVGQLVTPPNWLFIPGQTPQQNYVMTYMSAGPILPGASVTFILTATVRTGCGVQTNIARITHATTLPGVFTFERDEPLTTGSAGLIILGVGCPCVTAPAELVDWWPFDETAGIVPIANDIKGLVNNRGTYFGNPTREACVVKNGLCFHGNDYVEVADDVEVNFLGSCELFFPSPENFLPAESFTIDVWVKTTSNATLQVILDKRTNTGSVVGYHFFLSNGRVGFQMNGINFTEPSTGPNVADGQWHFIAVTMARCEGAIGRLYVDGNQVHSFVPLKTSMVNNAKLQIGRHSPAFGALYFNGCLDELEIFKRALAATELQAIYAAGSGGKCKPGLP